MGKIAIGTTGAIAVITGVALLGFSPAGCSCISPVNLLSFAAGYSAPGTLLSPAALEAEAYQVQAQFLHVSGLTRDALLTRMLGDQLGTCGAEPGY